MKTLKNKYLSGIILTLLSAIFWGFSGASSEFLLEEYNIPATCIGMMRMIGASIILFIFLFFKKKDKLKGLLKDRSSWLTLLIFSTTGLMANSLTYLIAISYTDAGTATVLQYIAPVFILIYVCLRNRKMPVIKEIIGVCLTMTGIFLITTHGNLNALVISPKGLFWGLISAVTLCIYNLSPRKIIEKWGTLVVLCYGMFIGGFFNMILFLQSNTKVEVDLTAIGAIFVIVVLGTAFPYTMYLMGVERIGAVKASMIATVEPLAATIFTAIMLGTKFTFEEIIGFGLIIATVILLSYKGKGEDKPVNKKSKEALLPKEV